MNGRSCVCSFNPVSYTHLDVYKRQRFKGFGRNRLYGVDDYDVRSDVLDMDVNLFQGSFAYDEAITGSTCQTVSYTHLDVYKRQKSYCKANLGNS